MKPTFYLAFAAALPLAACMDDGATGSAPQSASAAQAPMTPTAAMPYVSAAGAGDLYEIQSSRLALQKGVGGEVAHFAQMMIDDHTTTTKTVTDAAHSAGLMPPPPSLMPMQQQMIAQLQPLSGDAFERAYVNQQRQAHQIALELQRNYASNGDTPQLRQAATSAVPIIERHIEELQRL